MASAQQESESWLARLESDSQALADALEHYAPRLQQMVRVRMDPRLAARVDASDVLQETYMDARRQLASYVRNPRVMVYVWLRGLAWQRLLNLHRDHLGAQRRSAKRELRLPADSSVILAQQLMSSKSTPSKTLARHETQRRVQDALLDLSPADREVILMRHFEDMANGEMAQTLGLSDSGATMRYGRALVRLKEILVRELGSESDLNA